MRCRLAALVATFSPLVIAPACAQAQFQLGLQDAVLQQPAAGQAGNPAYGAMRTVAGSTVRVSVSWWGVAPGGSTKPPGFQASNPSDPSYDWGPVDEAVRTATTEHVRVMLMLFEAPPWAQGSNNPNNPLIGDGAWDPNPAEFAQFAHAAALRYSGSFSDPLSPGRKLPRVSLWEIWNEENLPYYLAAPNLVGEYRSLLDAAYTAIKAVRSDDIVATGGLAPVSFLGSLSVSPLKFAADLMCLQRVGTGYRKAKSCPQRAEFDVFAHHPYTLAATPTKPAYRYDDVLIGDMEKLPPLLAAAEKLHTVVPQTHHQIWVTEWGWFTNPPNKQVGDSERTAARYVAYSMYEMWHAGVSLVIWQGIRDDSPTTAGYTLGGGLYRHSGQPKLSLRAFAFPVVASVSRGRAFVWGRAPVSHSTSVVVQRFLGGRWKRLATVSTGADGVFYLRFRARSNGLFRARVSGGPVSLAYDSKPIPPRRTHLFYSG